MAKMNSSARSTLITIPAGVFVLLAAIVAYGFHLALIEASDSRALAQQRVMEEIANETREFCEQLGMRRGTGEFRKCSEQLMIIRQKQSDRDHASAGGVL